MFSSFSCPEERSPWLESPKGTSVSCRKGRSVYEGRLAGLLKDLALVWVRGRGEVCLDGLWEGMV